MIPHTKLAQRFSKCAREFERILRIPQQQSDKMALAKRTQSVVSITVNIKSTAYQSCIYCFDHASMTPQDTEACQILAPETAAAEEARLTHEHLRDSVLKHDGDGLQVGGGPIPCDGHKFLNRSWPRIAQSKQATLDKGRFNALEKLLNQSEMYTKVSYCMAPPR